MAEQQTSTPHFTISEVARRVGYSADTLRDLEERGVVRPFRTGSRLRLYSLEDLTALEVYRAGKSARAAAAQAKASAAAREARSKKGK